VQEVESRKILSTKKEGNARREKVRRQTRTPSKIEKFIHGKSVFSNQSRAKEREREWLHIVS